MALTPGGGSVSASMRQTDTGGLTPEEQAVIDAMRGSRDPEHEHVVADPPIPLGEQFDWKTKFRTDAVSAVEKWAEDLGVSKFALDSWVRDNIDGAIGFIVQNVPELPDPRDRISTGRPEAALPMGIYDKMWKHGLMYFSMMSGMPIGQDVSGGSGSGRRSSGPSGPTAEDIRNMFDLDQLTDATTNMWRAWLVEEPTQARAIAKSYVDTIVSTMGEQEVDFETFVQSHIKKSTRYRQVYQNKPDGVTELQYIQPFVQSATSVMGGAGGNQQAISDVVGGVAAVGASQDEMRARLMRTDAVQNSQGFIQNLEGRMNNVSKVLRG